MRYRFESGRDYLGGFVLPWWASIGMVRSAGEDQGFADVRVWKREDFPLPFAPPSDHFSHVALGHRTAPTAEIILPGEVAWVYDLSQPAAFRPDDAPPLAPQAIPAPVAPPERSSPLFWLGYVGAAAALVYGAGRLARRF